MYSKRASQSKPVEHVWVTLYWPPIPHWLNSSHALHFSLESSWYISGAPLISLARPLLCTRGTRLSVPAASAKDVCTWNGSNGGRPIWLRWHPPQKCLGKRSKCNSILAPPNGALPSCIQVCYIHKPTNNRQVSDILEIYKRDWCLLSGEEVMQWPRWAWSPKKLDPTRQRKAMPKLSFQVSTGGKPLMRLILAMLHLLWPDTFAWHICRRWEEKTIASQRAVTHIKENDKFDNLVSDS